MSLVLTGAAIVLFVARNVAGANLVFGGISALLGLGGGLSAAVWRMVNPYPRTALPFVAAFLALVTVGLYCTAWYKIFQGKAF